METKAEDLEGIRQRLEVLQSLIKFPPWAQVAERIAVQAEARQRELMSKPIGSIEDAMKLNFNLGIVAGMRAAVTLPEKMMELEREAFNSLLEEERDGD